MIINVQVTKAAATFTFDTATLPETSKNYGLEYGLRQTINDTVAGVARKDYASDEEFNAAALAKAQKRVDQLNSGNVPGSRTPADPKLAVVRKLVANIDAETLAKVDPAKLVAWLERQAQQGRAA